MAPHQCQWGARPDPGRSLCGTLRGAPQSSVACATRHAAHASRMRARARIPRHTARARALAQAGGRPLSRWRLRRRSSGDALKPDQRVARMLAWPCSQTVCMATCDPLAPPSLAALQRGLGLGGASPSTHASNRRKPARSGETAPVGQRPECPHNGDAPTSPRRASTCHTGHATPAPGRSTKRSRQTRIRNMTPAGVCAPRRAR